MADWGYKLGTTLILWAIPAAIAVVIVYAVIHDFRRWLSNRQCPVETRGARIVNKRMLTSGLRDDRYAFRAYYLTFELDDGTSVELRVPRKTYRNVGEGNVGVLRYRGTKFLEFVMQ